MTTEAVAALAEMPPRAEHKPRQAWMESLQVNDWSSRYASVNNLLLHLARKSKSEGSKRIYLWHLHDFCSFTGMKPDQLASLRRDRVERLVQSYADGLQSGSPRYSNTAIYTLKAFFASNGFKHARVLELETYHQPPRFRIARQYIPTKTEVYRMADSACSLRDRAIILLLYSSGLRNSTLRALRYCDVNEELRKGNVNILIPVYGEMKQVDPSACKGGIPYYSFSSDEATQAIRLYLQDREHRFGGLSEEEPLFASEYNQLPIEERRCKPLSPRELQIVVKSASRRAGIAEWESVHPHCLRKAFETVLHSQLIDGSNLDIKIQEFLMGHILPGSQDNYFDYSKVESLRAHYSKLKFGRAVVENKFHLLRVAAARAFEGTDIDPERVIEEYAKLKSSGELKP